MKFFHCFCFLLFLAHGCARQEREVSTPALRKPAVADSIGTPFPWLSRLQPCDGFSFPVGRPPLHGYYDAQAFGVNTHLGEDWNGTGGGNSDLGDTIFAVADGIVFYADYVNESWGNVMRIVHQVNAGVYVESFYGHVQAMWVKPGEAVKRRQAIATIGNANGRYAAHLHLEMRWKLGMGIGGGYSSDTSGFLNPSRFIKAHPPR